MAHERSKPGFSAEEMLLAAGFSPVCGVDEAGRGPWAGPVTAAAVILEPGAIPLGINDSKAMTHEQRMATDVLIRRTAKAWHVAHASVEEIDRLNILGATMLAMRRAVEGLHIAPAHALVDGNRKPELACPVTTMVKGDARSLSIAAASILAKTARDRLMAELDLVHPGYDFARHKGYGTAAHLDALKRLGPSKVHRLSFAPIKALQTQHMD